MSILKSFKAILIFITLCMLWGMEASGQRFAVNTDMGFFGGVAYYQGDINARRQFYRPDLAVGVLLKHNFNPRHVLRINIDYGQLKGSDLDFATEYQRLRGSSFSTNLGEVCAGYEFNFLSFMATREHPHAHTPYLFLGLGCSFIVSSTIKKVPTHFTIPFGVGYKFKFNERIGAGFEWGMRKTFTDKIDGLANPGIDGGYNVFHNNDWYSFAGVYITFRIFEASFSCPAYRQEPAYK